MNDGFKGTIPSCPPVNFEFRYGRNIEEHSHQLKIRECLVRKFTKESIIEELERIELYPVARAGKSSSEVFYMDLFTTDRNRPKRYIAKFQIKRDTQKEYEAALTAKDMKICSRVHKAYHPEEDIGLIVYDLAKIEDHTEFRGYFLDTKNPDESCRKALESAFKNIGNHPYLLSSLDSHKTFIDDYEWYVERSSQPEKRISSFKETSDYYEGISTLATRVSDYYESLKGVHGRIKVFPYLVHGDLHARNLMLSEANPEETELIDFGWTHSGHPAKDLSLMESTLKYMLLHELLGKMGQDKKASIHLPLVAYESLEEYLCKNVFDLPEVNDFFSSISSDIELEPHHESALQRVYICLQQVRKSAKRILMRYCEEHQGGEEISAEKQYLMSNFLITFGLSGFSEVQPIWTLIGLDIIGKELCQG